MNWNDIQNRLMHNRLCATLDSKTVPDRCSYEEQDMAGHLYLVCTTPNQRKLFWDDRIKQWLTPRQVNPADAFQKLKRLEHDLNILAVLPLDVWASAAQSDLKDLLENVSASLVVTRARQMLSFDGGKPDYEMVALVTM
jgi:hypothetical protein